MATALPNGACKHDDRSFGVPAKEKLGCVYTYTDSKVSGYPGRRYPGKCEAFTRIKISGAVVRHACAMRYQHDLRPSFEGQSCLAARYLSGFSVIHES